MGTGKKIHRDEVQRRLRFVEDALAAFVPTSELYASFCKHFQTTRRTAEKYLARVQQQWASEAQPSRDAKRIEIERAAELTFREARAKKNHKAMLGALELKAKLHGLTQHRTNTDAPTGDIEVVFECEAAPEVPAQADMATGGDPPGIRAIPGAGRR